MNYSPLRYPGGKAKFAPYVKKVIHRLSEKIDTYIEPFAGGAGVALELLFSGEVKNIVINDYDKAVYSFWRAVVNDTGSLVSLIENTEVNIKEWHKQKQIYMECAGKYSVELAFATFFLNRTNRSGILSAGPIGGYQQQGNYLLDARYNKDNLIRRIEAIALYKKSIRVYNKEVRSFISGIISQYGDNAFVYFDPPYFNKGSRLYKNCLSKKDHMDIAEIIKRKVTCEWIITYDDAEEIKEIYKDNYYRVYDLIYSIVTSHVKSEIVIFKDGKLCPEYDLQEQKTKISII